MAADLENPLAVRNSCCAQGYSQTGKANPSTAVPELISASSAVVAAPVVSIAVLGLGGLSLVNDGVRAGVLDALQGCRTRSVRPSVAEITGILRGRLGRR